MQPRRKLKQRGLSSKDRKSGFVPWGLGNSGERRRREFSGEEQGKLIVAWVNGEPFDKGLGRCSLASRKRITDLISNIQELTSVASHVPTGKKQLMLERDKEIDLLERELESRLSKYPTVPFPYFDCDNRLVLDLGALSGPIPAGESVTAHSVVKLYGIGLLDRVRQCICKRWFFARFRNQQSCSPKCRHSSYEKTEQFKAKRREYMRRYYRLKTSGKVR